jgi:hypothetical protein
MFPRKLLDRTGVSHSELAQLSLGAKERGGRFHWSVQLDVSMILLVAAGDAAANCAPFHPERNRADVGCPFISLSRRIRPLDRESDSAIHRGAGCREFAGTIGSKFNLWINRAVVAR